MRDEKHDLRFGASLILGGLGIMIVSAVVPNCAWLKSDSGKAALLCGAEELLGAIPPVGAALLSSHGSACDADCMASLTTVATSQGEGLVKCALQSFASVKPLQPDASADKVTLMDVPPPASAIELCRQRAQAALAERYPQ